MEWIERLNSAINYMEEHMRDRIDYEEVSKIACCSTYHFQGCLLIWPTYHYQNI